MALVISAPACQRAPEPAPPARPVSLGAPTLEAEWTDLGRLEQRLAAERGRVVVVNFWATWCEPCRQEFPDFIELQRRHAARGLLVLAVSLDAPSERDTEVKKFLAEMQPVFPVLLKTAGDPDEFINAIDPKWTGSLPATLIYDRGGKRRHALFVPQTLATLERYVEPLLHGREPRGTFPHPTQ
ncbi:MAG: TlpA disulfide reductase family protein [Candidatus Acidiferrales bacterium]